MNYNSSVVFTLKISDNMLGQSISSLKHQGNKASDKRHDLNVKKKRGKKNNHSTISAKEQAPDGIL